ncbi:MAG: beta-lactamase family protein [Chitinophagaceae bacterium]|nr:beta-lactamase family protein [Chitinophagaceae bacterium]
MKRLLFIILLAVSAVCSDAQKSRPMLPAVPESAGFSSERLKRIDNALNEWVSKGWMQGAVALLVRDGKVVYHKAAGYNDLDTKTAMQKDGIFRIASQTKAITSVAIMILFEEGKLLLNDPVSKYIPSFKKQAVLDKFNAADTTYTTVPATRDITIKDLLTHTSGLGYAQIGSREANAIYAKHNITAGLAVADRSLLDAMTELGSLPLMHQPGQKWTYGLNTDLLGCLVEVISGMSLNDFFRTKIFEPLGMKDTYFTLPAEKAKRLVHLYGEDSTGKLVKSGGNMLNGAGLATYPLEKYAYYSGGAGLSSTIYDYGVFLQMLLNGGEYNGKRVLSRNTVRMMTMNQLGDTVFRGDDKFGLGFQVVSEKNGNIPAQAGTFSWGGAFATSYWVDPKEKIVMLFYRQLQRTTHGEVVEKFRALTYAALND